MPQKTTTTKISKTLRTSEGLRDVLFDELESLRDGSVDAKHARAVAALASSIIGVVQVELAFAKVDAKPLGKPLLSPIRLGAR